MGIAHNFCVVFLIMWTPQSSPLEVAASVLLQYVVFARLYDLQYPIQHLLLRNYSFGAGDDSKHFTIYDQPLL